MTRCFIAIDIDDSLKESIAALQDEIARCDTKLVEQENLHFTLKFLGEISDSDIQFIEGKLAKISEKFVPFELRISGCGVFPSLSYMRVVWFGTSSEELVNLQNTVNDALTERFTKEHASPHLTIARVRSAKHREEIADFVKKHGNTEIGAMRVAQIKLKKSVVTRRGPVYEDLAVFELSGK